MKLPGLNYTSPVKFSLGQRVQLATVPPVVSLLAKGLYGCNHIEVRNATVLQARLEAGLSTVVGIWHETALLAAAYHRNRNFHVITSYSFDGELAARLLACYGIESVRGSSSRGGAEGLRQMEKALPQVGVVGLTMDGPRGPRRDPKPGAVILSARTQTPIIPNAYAASKHWRLRTWDRLCVPKPFGRIICAFAEPIAPPSDDSREAIEETRIQVRESLNALHALLEAELSSPEAAEPA